MNGWCKFIATNSDEQIIEYSLSEPAACDGKLSWNKFAGQITITRLADGASRALTNQFICAVRGRIRRGFEFNRLYYLAV